MNQFFLASLVFAALGFLTSTEKKAAPKAVADNAEKPTASVVTPASSKEKTDSVESVVTTNE